jgi:hypothetical protein
MSAVLDAPPRAPRLARNSVLARYLNVSDMTRWRWQRDSDLGFPQPSVINKIEYTDLNLVDDWLIARRIDRAKQHAEAAA